MEENKQSQRDAQVEEIIEATHARDMSLEEAENIEPGEAVVDASYIDNRKSEVTFDSMSTPQESDDWEYDIPPHKNGALPQVLECMLFVSSEPLTADVMAETLGHDIEIIENALNMLDESLSGRSGLQLMRVAGGYQICTRPEYADYCTAILKPATKKLSRAALETLAVIAYRQPCTVPEIDAVRGVNVGGVVKTLVERGLVKEAGKKQAAGRPMMYATTPEFLEYFGLNDLTELPDIDMVAVEEVKALEEQMEIIIEETGVDETGIDTDVSIEPEEEQTTDTE